MTSAHPNDARVKDLVAKFTEIGIAQYRAAYVIDTAKYNRLYKEMQHVRAELRSMPGDQRRAVLPLLAHSNVQVRLMAANTLLGIDPRAGRRFFYSKLRKMLFTHALLDLRQIRAGGL